MNSKTLKVKNETYNKLMNIKEEKGFQTFDEVISFLIKQHEKLKQLLLHYKLRVALEHLEEAHTILGDPEVRKILKEMFLEQGVYTKAVFTGVY